MDISESTDKYGLSRCLIGTQLEVVVEHPVIRTPYVRIGPIHVLTNPTIGQLNHLMAALEGGE